MARYYVYLIISTNKNKVISYVGYTNNLEKRLLAHNSSKGAKFTRGRKWKMIYSKSFASKSEAMKAEIKLKKNILLRKKIKNQFIYAKT